MPLDEQLADEADVAHNLQWRKLLDIRAICGSAGAMMSLKATLFGLSARLEGDISASSLRILPTPMAPSDPKSASPEPPGWLRPSFSETSPWADPSGSPRRTPDTPTELIPSVAQS